MNHQQKSGKTLQDKALEYFRLNIIDAKIAYTLLKALYQSRTENIVGKELSDKYLWIQQWHSSFFSMVEYCAVNTFIVKILHGFDKDERSLTLIDINKKAYEEFINESTNKSVLKKLKTLRNKYVAHFDKDQSFSKKLPPFNEIDVFFENIQEFYNKLSRNFENSVTLFNQDKEFRKELDRVFKNLYIGEQIRRLNIEMKWQWEENPRKIANK